MNRDLPKKIELVIHCLARTCTRYLLSKKACIESYKLNEWTPLMYAANSGCLEVCKELIASKASAFCAPDSPLCVSQHLPCHFAPPEYTSIFVDIRALNKEKATPLMLASRTGHVEVHPLHTLWRHCTDGVSPSGGAPSVAAQGEPQHRHRDREVLSHTHTSH